MTQEDKNHTLLLTTPEEVRKIPVGTKITITIGGHPAGLRFKPYYSDGIQTDDIGGEYYEVPEVPGMEVTGVVIEAPHPMGKRKNKLFKQLQWVDNNGKVYTKLLKNVKNARIMIER